MPAKASSKSTRSSPRKASKVADSPPSLKRKQVPKSESDEEVIPLSTPLPSKKARRMHPSPGTPEFAQLPPVSTDKSPSIVSEKASKLVFGSINDDGDELDAYSSSPVPEVSNKRLRKPSNKVRYMEADADPDVPVNKKTSKSQVSSPAKSQLSSAKAQKPTLSVVDISSSEDDQPLMSARQEKSTVQAKGNRTPAVTGSAKKVAGGRSAASPQAVVMSSSEDEQLPTSVKQEKSSPQAKDKRALAGVASSIGKAAGRRDVARMTAPQEVPTHVSESEIEVAQSDRSSDDSVPREVIPRGRSKYRKPMPVATSEGEISDREDIVDKDQSSRKGKSVVREQESSLINDGILSASEDGLVPVANDSPSPVEENAQYDQVMREELQDLLLKPTYVNLPRLTYCELNPFSSGASSGESTMLLYSLLLDKLLLEEEKKRLRRSVLFVSHGCYFNPARIDPTLLSVNSSRLVVANTRQTAVLITTGAVLQCTLVHAGVGGTTQSSYRVKNISIYPLSQEYERSISCIGSVYNATELYGPVSAGALTFSTRRDSAGPSSPKKRKGFFNSVESTSRRGGSAYPQSLGLDDTVPIYDGRKDPINGPGFNFKAPAFDNIKSLPLYAKGSIDLPPYAVVTVGYSVNTYAYGTGGEKNKLALSPNILFVILLGFPEEEKQ